MSNRLTAVSIALGLLLVSGCSDASVDPPGSSATEMDGLDAAAVADAIGCEDIEDAPYDGPIRLGLARDGVACVVGRSAVEIYNRQSRGDFEQLLGISGEAGTCSSWTVATDEWFVVTDDREVLAQVSRIAGEGVSQLQRISPPFSYLPPGDCRS